MAKQKQEAGKPNYLPKKFVLPKKGGLTAIYTEVKPFGNGGNSVVNECSVSFGYEPTQDFKTCMRRLVPHLVMYMEIEHAYDMELSDHLLGAVDESIDSPYRFKSYFVKGVTIREEGAAIQGGKYLKNGQVLPINTPLIRYGEVSENGYQYLGEFESAIADAVGEFHAFLNGKFTTPAQQQLDFTEETEALKMA